MATGPGFGTNVGWDFSYPNDIDMSSNQFKFVTLGTDTYLDVCGAGLLALGIIQDNPNGATITGVMSQVRTGGVSKVGCGGTFSPGNLLSSDGSGLAVVYTAATVYTGTPYTVSGTQVLGIANEPGAAGGGFSSMLFRPSGLSA